MIRRIQFGDFWVNDFSLEKIILQIENSVEGRQKTIIANHNLHSIYLSLKDKQLLDFYNQADFIHIDGMPIVWINQLLGEEISKDNRITHLDWIYTLLETAERKKWRVFYLGSKSHVTNILPERIGKICPNLVFHVNNGYFDMDTEENQEVIQKINDFQPDILFVGMGMPRQELWIRKVYHQVESIVFLPCGAYFDYLAGEKKIPPRWTGKLGIEWFYRLLNEPKRLFRRYLIEPFFVLPYFWSLLLNRRK